MYSKFLVSSILLTLYLVKPIQSDVVGVTIVNAANDQDLQAKGQSVLSQNWSIPLNKFSQLKTSNSNLFNLLTSELSTTQLPPTYDPNWVKSNSVFMSFMADGNPVLINETGKTFSAPPNVASQYSVSFGGVVVNSGVSGGNTASGGNTSSGNLSELSESVDSLVKSQFRSSGSNSSAYSIKVVNYSGLFIAITIGSIIFI